MRIVCEYKGGDSRLGGAFLSVCPASKPFMGIERRVQHLKPASLGQPCWDQIQ